MTTNGQRTSRQPESERATEQGSVDLSISIVSWNTRELLDQCLASVFAATQGISYEVIVVDNASSDGSVEMVRRKYPSVRLIQNRENVGFAAANNQAYSACSGRHFMMLNSDTLVRTDPAAVVGFLDANGSAGAVGCKCLNADGTVQRNWYDYYPTTGWEVLPEVVREMLQGAIYRRNPDRVFPTKWVGGQCMTIRRAAAEQAGLMDTSYFMYGEETDWCFRLRKLGWQVFHFPGLVIVHYGGQSTRQVRVEMLLQLYESKIRFMRKNLSPTHGTIFKYVLYLRTLVLRYVTLICASATARSERLEQCDALLFAIRRF